MDLDISVKLRLSLQRALISNLSTHVRGICCDWNVEEKWLKVRYYLDIEPTEDEKELQSITLTEVACDFDEFQKFHEECIFSDQPYQVLDKLKLVVLWRNEASVFN